MAHHHKDIISKDLLKRLVLDMVEHLFGRPLRDAEILNEEHQLMTTGPRTATTPACPCA